MAKPVDVGVEDFEAEVLQVDGQPVFVDFWSETCGHCLALNPHYDQAADENDEIKFTKVSFQQAKDLFKDYGVRATPTLVLFHEGEEIARTVGAKRAEELHDWLAEQLAD
jgi:thioredoxin-like negative regulator of GroEL